jgi:hypothetical protein
VEATTIEQNVMLLLVENVVRHADVYSIQLYVMKFIRMVNFTGYCRVLHQNKNDPHDIIEMVL